jgi:hypothetical protein
MTSNTFTGSSDRIQQYLRKGRSRFSDLFPNQEFDAPFWNVSSLRKSQSKSNKCVFWTEFGSQDRPLPADFINPVKAACLQDLNSISNLKFRSNAARMLWRTLEKKHSKNLGWEDLSSEDMLDMEEEMKKHWAASTVYKTCSPWNRVLELLAAARIVRPLQIIWGTPRPEDSGRYTLEGQEERKNKYLPSSVAIKALAEVYRDLATTSKDRLLSCITAILLATGLRIGEVLTLPLDCLSRVESDGRDRWHLRYWKEKSGRHDERDLLHLADKPASLVREAIREIRELTEPARRRAKLLEANPGRAPIAGLDPDDEPTTGEVQEILGLASGSATGRVRRTGIPIQEAPNPGYKRPRYWCLPSDIEAYLLERQGELWVVNPSYGDQQMLSESLFVVNVNFFHTTRGAKSLLVEPVAHQPVSDFLNGRWTECKKDHDHAEKRNGKWMRCIVQSVFRRFNLKEGDGREVEMTSHQFRHWVTTNLVDGGASDATIARWQNRAHDPDLSAYKHTTREDRLREVKAGIVSGRVQGEMADLYFSLAEDVRDVWLDSHLQHVHVTPMGLCGHDFTASPCPHYLQCLNGCEDYLIDLTDEAPIRTLKKLMRDTEELIQLEIKQADENGERLDENWLSAQRRIIENGGRALEAARESESETVRPFAGQGSNYEGFESDSFIPIDEAMKSLDDKN